MDRYLLSELILVFLFSLGLFSSLGVAVGTLSDIFNRVVEYHLPIHLAIQVFFLKVPEYMSYSFPVSLLLCVLMTYSRLSSDSELVALRSFGISLYRVVIPAVVFCFVITGITFIFNELVVPSANYQATTILHPFAPPDPEAQQNYHVVYPQYEQQSQGVEDQKRLKLLFYAEKFEQQMMSNVTVLYWQKARLTRIILARSAEWQEQQKIWDFKQGRIYYLDPDGSYQKTISFKQQKFPFSKGALDLVSKYRDPYDMNITQALEYMEILRLSGDNKTLSLFQVRTQQKIALPFVCLVFGIVGAALGSRPQNTSRATSFGLCLGIVFSYYLLSFMIGGLGIVNLLTPFMAAWLPNFFGLGIGGWLLYQVAQ